jgi:uncharacterized protein
MNSIDPRLVALVAAQPHPLIFVTISGAHLYGFPSADSDWDLRGVHVLPAGDLLGLGKPEDTVAYSRKPEGPGDLDVDLVAHDLRKFMLPALKRNGYVLEQLYSPLVIHTTPEHEELKSLGCGCITRHHAHHYLGFARTQWGLFAKESPPRAKPLLYVYRVLLTGIHLMRSGRIEANLLKLNTPDLCGEGFPLPYINELVARKVEGGERCHLTAADMAFHEQEYQRLTAVLEEAGQASRLPDRPTAREAMNDLLLRARKRYEQG